MIVRLSMVGKVSIFCLMLCPIITNDFWYRTKKIKIKNYQLLCMHETWLTRVYSRGSRSFGCRQFDVYAHHFFFFFEKRDFINKESQTRYKPSSMCPHTSFAIWWTVLKLPWIIEYDVRDKMELFFQWKKRGTFLEIEKCKHTNYAMNGW